MTIPSLNANSISFIPKVQGVDLIQYLRRIIVANFDFEIITNVLVDLLSCIIMKNCPPYKFGFIKGMGMVEDINIKSKLLTFLMKGLMRKHIHKV